MSQMIVNSINNFYRNLDWNAKIKIYWGCESWYDRLTDGPGGPIGPGSPSRPGRPRWPVSPCSTKSSHGEILDIHLNMRL